MFLLFLDYIFYFLCLVPDINLIEILWILCWNLWYLETKNFRRYLKKEGDGG